MEYLEGLVENYETAVRTIYEIARNAEKMHHCCEAERAAHAELKRRIAEEFSRAKDALIDATILHYEASLAGSDTRRKLARSLQRQAVDDMRTLRRLGPVLHFDETAAPQ